MSKNERKHIGRIKGLIDSVLEEENVTPVDTGFVDIPEDLDIVEDQEENAGNATPVIEIIDALPGKKLIVHPLSSTKKTYSLETMFPGNWERVQDCIVKAMANANLVEEDYFYTSKLIKFEVIGAEKREPGIKLEIVKDLDIAYNEPRDIEVYWISERECHDFRGYTGHVIPMPEDRRFLDSTWYGGGEQKRLSAGEIEWFVIFFRMHNVDPEKYLFKDNGEPYKPPSKITNYSMPCYAFLRDVKNITRGLLESYINQKIKKTKNSIYEREKEKEGNTKD